MVGGSNIESDINAVSRLVGISVGFIVAADLEAQESILWVGRGVKITLAACTKDQERPCVCGIGKRISKSNGSLFIVV